MKEPMSNDEIITFFWWCFVGGESFVGYPRFRYVMEVNAISKHKCETTVRFSNQCEMIQDNRAMRVKSRHSTIYCFLVINIWIRHTKPFIKSDLTRGSNNASAVPRLRFFFNVSKRLHLTFRGCLLL